MSRSTKSTLAALILSALLPAQALAWGGMGHRIVGEAAQAALPAELPAFLRSREAILAAGELAREPDRSKGAGRVHDQNRDAGHFVDLDDAGRVHGGPHITALPPTRADYEKAMQAVGMDSWKGGYLPYSIVDQSQQLAKDFAHWRAETYMLAHEKDRGRKAWLKADRARREAQIFQTIGYLSHFVGDGAQPLHVTMHYNGWGDYPNPAGYTNDKVHGPFEGDLVLNNLKTTDVSPGMTPLAVCKLPIEACVALYLATTHTQVIPFYEMNKAGGMAPGSRAGVEFARTRLAAGASELRDLIVWAWGASDSQSVGWTPVPLKDILSGKTDAYGKLYGID